MMTNALRAMGADGLPVVEFPKPNELLDMVHGLLELLQLLRATAKPIRLDDERGSALLDHVLTCPKRPEMKLLDVALAAE